MVGLGMRRKWVAEKQGAARLARYDYVVRAIIRQHPIARRGAPRSVMASRPASRSAAPNSRKGVQQRESNRAQREGVHGYFASMTGVRSRSVCILSARPCGPQKKSLFLPIRLLRRRGAPVRGPRSITIVFQLMQTSSRQTRRLRPLRHLVVLGRRHQGRDHRRSRADHHDHIVTVRHRKPHIA